MSTSNGSANPLYPFNWLDAVRAAAWAPPNLPLYPPGISGGQASVARPQSEAIGESDDDSSKPAHPFNWLDPIRAAAWDPPNLALYGPGAAPSSWDRFPLAQRTTEDRGDRAPTQDGLAQGPALANAGGPDTIGANAEASWPGLAHSHNESVLRDIAKAVPGGLARGVIGSIGAPADTNQLNKSIGSTIGDMAGISPETQSKIGAGYDFAAKTGLLGPLLSLGMVTPTSDTIKNAVEEKIGRLPEAQTLPGQYVQTGFEFLPALLANKGSLLRSLVANVVLPAILSETAGQLTKGTAAEPYMRMLGALVGGAAGAKMGEPAQATHRVPAAPPPPRSGNVDEFAGVVPRSTHESSPISQEPFAAHEVTGQDLGEHLPRPPSVGALDGRERVASYEALPGNSSGDLPLLRPDALDRRLENSINPETGGDRVYERPKQQAPIETQAPLATGDSSRVEGGEDRIARPAIRTEPPMLWDYGRRMDEWLDVPQFNIERGRPPRDIPRRVVELDTPENRARDDEFANRGLQLGGHRHVNLRQLHSFLVDELGQAKGNEAFVKFTNFHGATSLRSPADQSLRNAGYYFHLDQQGLPIPQPRREGTRLVLDERIPRHYWHPLQPLYALKIHEIRKHGRLLPLRNPKSASLAENSQGNQLPWTWDINDSKRVGLLDSKENLLRTPGVLYRGLEPLMQLRAAAFGLPPAQYRTALRYGAAELTGLRSPLEPLLRTLERRIEITANEHGLSKEEAFRRVAHGEIPLLSLGGLAIAGGASPSQTENPGE